MCAKMPKYIELYSELRHAIMLGEYPVGSFLPTENELIERYQVSKTTIRHAVKLLREHKLVEVKQGSGTRVLALEQETVTASKYNTPGTNTAVTVRFSTQGKGEVHNTKAVIDTIPANDTVAKALQVEPGTMIYRLQRLQLVDGVTFGYMVNYISEEVAPDLPSKGELITDLYGHLFRHYGVKVNEIEETVDALLAGFMEAQYLQVDINTPLIVLRRMVTGEQSPIEYCETIVRPDIFHMMVKINSTDAPEVEPFI